jgi:hypothetical protein
MFLEPFLALLFVINHFGAQDRGKFLELLVALSVVLFHFCAQDSGMFLELLVLFLHELLEFLVHFLKLSIVYFGMSLKIRLRTRVSSGSSTVGVANRSTVGSNGPYEAGSFDTNSATTWKAPTQL